MSKFRKLLLLTGGIAVSLASCMNDYRGTGSVCNGRLFVEMFQVTWPGEYAAYLTDSTNFRIRLGMFDPEQDIYTVDCWGDSVVVEKVTRGRGTDYKVHEVESRGVYRLEELKKKHNLK